MGATRQVEWIGVMSPLQSERVTMRKILHLYSDQDEVDLEALADFLSPLIRQPGSTARAKGMADGLSQDYQWGPRHYVLTMQDIDADRLFNHHPDEYEFRDRDNPAHDERTPIVPWEYLKANVFRILEEARNGPGVVLVNERSATTDRQAMDLIEGWKVEREGKAVDRGFTLDKDLRLIRAQR